MEDILWLGLVLRVLIKKWGRNGWHFFTISRKKAKVFSFYFIEFGLADKKKNERRKGERWENHHPGNHRKDKFLHIKYHIRAPFELVPLSISCHIVCLSRKNKMHKWGRYCVWMWESFLIFPVAVTHRTSSPKTLARSFWMRHQNAMCL